MSNIERIASRRSVLIVIVLLFAIGTVAVAESRLPHGDEGHFASCAWEFLHRGRLACPMWTEWIPSLDRYMYIMMPLYFVQLGIVSGVSGYEISALRLDSVAWGVLLVISCYFIVAGLTKDRLLSALALILVALNYDVMNMSSGRYDPMCAALNMAGIACYVWWREHNLQRAVLLSNCVLAGACLTHPYGLFGLVGFAILFAMLDLRRISLRLVLAAAAPYVVAFGSWGLYIAQNPTEFVRQITTAASGRLSVARHPIEALGSDVRMRYLEAFAGFRPAAPVYMRVKVFLLVAYAAGFAGCLLTGPIRQDKAKLALVLFGLVSAMILTFMEGYRLYIYMVHVLPIYSIVLAIWSRYLLCRVGIWRKAIPAGVALFCVYSLAVVAYRVRLNEYRSLYEPTLEFLSQNVEGNDLVMGPPQFGTRLGFRQHCLDDETLGFRNGLTPSYVVIDPDFEERESRLRENNPRAFSHVRGILEQSDLVFHRERGPNFYRVYRLRRHEPTRPQPITGTGIRTVP